MSQPSISQHKLAMIQQATLPQLLFRQCHSNCVDSELFSAESDSERLCLRNCQQKTYKAFDMYMMVRKRYEMETSHHDSIDVSVYTEMEVEHAHNTSGSIQQDHGTHLSMAGVQDFVDNVQQKHGAVRGQAMGL